MGFACFIAFLAVCVFVEALRGHEDMRLAYCVAFLAVVVVAEALRDHLELNRALQRGIYPAKGKATMEDVRRLALSDKGAWVDIPAGDQVALGVRASRLGELVLGRRVYDAAGRFRVVIGPLTSEGHGRFTYGGALRRVTEVLDALVAEPLEREIVLWLAADAAPQLRPLGWGDAWLAGQPRSVRLRVDENAAVAENAATGSVATENTVATEIAAVVENAATKNVVAENVAVAAVVGQAA